MLTLSATKLVGLGLILLFFLLLPIAGPLSLRRKAIATRYPRLLIKGLIHLRANSNKISA